MVTLRLVFMGHFAHKCYVLGVNLMVSMGEVQACHIHTGLDPRL